MAEALVNHLAGEEWVAYSAGIKPAGYVHPLAIEVMSELGIDISNRHSKTVQAFRGQDFDLVITVCDDAAKNCPAWLGKGPVQHMGFTDPAAAEGTEEEKRAVFCQVRDDIRERMLPFVEEVEV